MTPSVAKNATEEVMRKEPRSVKNSPTKPEVPGQADVGEREHHEGRA